MANLLRRTRPFVLALGTATALIAPVTALATQATARFVEASDEVGVFCEISANAVTPISDIAGSGISLSWLRPSAEV